MPDKELVQTVLEAVGVTRDRREGLSNRCRDDDDDECCCPEMVVYLIFTDCVTINNGACEEWEFCKPCRKD